jgi:methanogenic corrinoid protein MtbC1
MSDSARGEISFRTMEQRKQHLVRLIIELKEQACMDALAAMLSEGCSAMELLEACIQGMQAVGKRFEEKRYFIAALIMAGEIMHQATEFLEPHFPRQHREPGKSTILLGTVAGDIHDLGKNLFAILARCNGFNIIDLGVEVLPEYFLIEARRIKPDIVGLSCVLTSAISALKNTVELLRKELPNPQPSIIIGGSCIDEQIAAYINADFSTQDAAIGLRQCREFIRNKSQN